MNTLSPISNINFKGYVPVNYYAINPNGTKTRIISKENIKKCQGKIVRNLNRTIKTPNKEFIEYYKSFDSDYVKCPFVCSVYDYRSSCAYLVSGRDAQNISDMARPIGISKGEAKRKTGSAKSFESNNAANQYFKNARDYIKNRCKRLKSKDDKDVSLNVFYTPKYTKDGKLKDLELKSAQFVEII